MKKQRKTVKKLYRLARELEAANGVAVNWSMFPLGGKIYIYFEAMPKNRKETHFPVAAGETVQEALRNFYEAFGWVLRWGEKENYREARYSLSENAYAASGLHGKQVVLA
ncbi:MAG: hypothetical protein BWY31_04366 [Lentisphaerae bacterium ADurb.Bin242]|nr:MAG: hypothetical protein BWY31_04366 [Lentisphaerae bacterium ADurb.Bin242]